MQFSELGLSAELLRAVGEQGYTTPTPVQQQAIPHILAGRDLEALAQTGTGKTAAFVLPILQRLTAAAASPLQKVTHTAPRVLVLVPTRELAAQVLESVRTYGAHTGLRSLAVFGGVGINPQIQTMRRGIDILVATPGRLLDHLGQRTVDLSKVQMLVLDEADRMFDMGFIRDIRRIIERLPKERQNLMFSATFAAEVRELAHTVLRNPAMVEVARRNAPAELVTHTVIKVDQDRKRDLLLHLFAAHGWHQVLVFCRTKHGSDALARKLEQAGVRTAALHGNKSQNARTRALADFKSGKLAALVATDIAARGLDIDSLPRVVNFELPNVPEDYIHRIGRTGRAGASGEALSLVSSDERIQLRDIERLLKREIETSILPGFEPQHNHSVPRPAAGRTPAAKPAQGRSRTGAGNRSGAPRPARSGGGGGGGAKPASHHSGQRHR
ncbi:DEAD/DEAH box helicase [Sulfuritalea hydrogenivorans]|jgi:ATP-dependent RNA helicase RhlE|uniref:DEAD-box ATP-dependent RNA helicase RhpA n=1 Tax=Sulfuritalea hydrogenivorans sk43H TaxID=1223802 RepID=W0SAB5_9PROT|nr:DEAD/DEAH box helicase [Sulfuritalea hydrogenivorans]MDK9713828.1 DEAD/DEAH box helicase [Sulfuritalea sp.]BAO27931.1 helicase, C-terminal:DEAD/DEAH box helicase, N-terminal [Sulfuritalea hydrogenivorans sk43H]